MSVSDWPYRILVSHVSADVTRPRHERNRCGPRQEPRTVHRRRLAAKNRTDQIRQLRGIELEIGILDRGDRPARPGQPDPHRMPFPAVLRKMDDRHAPGHRQRRRGLLVFRREDPSLTTMISRVDREIDGQQPVDDRGDGGAFVVDGNDDGQELGQRVGG